MAFPQFVRDPNTPEPSDLDEEEQKATIVKAAKKRGGVHRGEEVTVLPLGTPRRVALGEQPATSTPPVRESLTKST
jgi:hypothetical protein